MDPVVFCTVKVGGCVLCCSYPQSNRTRWHSKQCAIAHLKFIFAFVDIIFATSRYTYYCLYMFICAPLATSWNTHNLVQLRTYIQWTMMLMMMLIIIIIISWLNWIIAQPKRPHADGWALWQKQILLQRSVSFISAILSEWKNKRIVSNKIMKWNQLCCCDILVYRKL